MFFFLPISADRAVYGMPWFTIGTIGLCVLVYLASFFGQPIDGMGLVPAAGIGPTYLLYAFAHAGFLHLFGNMLFLWCMGVNLETRWGTGAFAAVYLIGAVISGAVFAKIHAGSTIPLVGASGAISALMGAFLVSLVTTRIRIFYFVWIFIRIWTGTFRIPAYVVLPFWFASDLLGAYGEVEAGGSGVAYSAHVSGFVFGFLVALLLRVTGLEAKLLERSGDIGDDPAEWSNVPAVEPGPSRYPTAIPPPIRSDAPPMRLEAVAGRGLSTRPPMPDAIELDLDVGNDHRSTSPRPDATSPGVSRSSFPAPGIRRSSQPAPVVQPPHQRASSPAGPQPSGVSSWPPSGPAIPKKCASCGLVNMPGAAACRRCQAAIV
ncbi:MAG: rhomboid family intramembrane serine protease [Polyangiaceae bacterium]